MPLVDEHAKHPYKVTTDDLLSTATDNSPKYFPFIIDISDEKAL